MDAKGPVYYYYKGSLTTPGCNEVVNWIVLEKTVPISESQVRIYTYVDLIYLLDTQNQSLSQPMLFTSYFFNFYKYSYKASEN